MKYLKNRKFIISNLIIFIILLMGVVWVFNDYGIYTKTIIKVTKVEESDSGQTITGKIMNGEYKGKYASTVNEYSNSGIFNESYHKGDELFVAITGNTDKGISCGILDVKRDKYLAILAAVFIWGILLVAKKKGLFSLISVCINIILLYYAIDLYTKGHDVLSIFNWLVIIYTLISMVFISGFTKKTLASVISILAALFITIAIFKIVYSHSKGVEYWLMDYMVNTNDLYKLFTAELLVCGLGAIMDVAISISATISELVSRNPEIPARKLFVSAREVGYDIMGTMINIMLFTFVSGTIPLIVLQMKNGYRLISIITMHMPFEIYRFLIGSIGILLTVPISMAVSIALMKGKAVIEHD
jgi:uncharacterized membrane protein